MQGFHNTYRPQNLSRIIGHETVVTRLKGMVATGEIPNAIAFFGPTSSGKTTLSRAFAADINGLKTIIGSRDWLDVNASADRSIDDIRQIQQQAKFRPQHKVRVICIDEAHGLLGNAIAANALLKMLEQPPKNTLFIIASMEPAKFQSTQLGRAILNRCSQFILEAHSEADLMKQAKRIIKAEKMNYLDDEDTLKTLIKVAPEMRSLANIIEAAFQYYSGLEKKVKVLDKKHIAEILQSTESRDDVLALTVMQGVYELSFTKVQRALLDVQEGFTFVKKLLWLNQYVLNTTILKGARHPKVWASVNGKALVAHAEKEKVKLGYIASINATLVETQGQLQQFATSPEELLSARLYRLIEGYRK